MTATYTDLYKDWVTVTADTGAVVSAIAFKPGTKLATEVYTVQTVAHDPVNWDAMEVLHQRLREEIDARENPTAAAVALIMAIASDDGTQEPKSRKSTPDATLWEG